MAEKKQILKNKAIAEIYKCSRDPIHFIENYCKIRHPTKGLLSFKLYEYQKQAINNFLYEDKNIINKARQLGFSTVVASFIVWLILFHNDKEVLIMATKADVAKNLIKKIKLMLKHIPDWMYLVDITTNQAHSIGLSNGSSVKAVAKSEDAGRSESLALLVIDEAAHIRDMDEIWKAAASTLATGGKAIALSSPKGSANWFYKFCSEAISGENGWKYQEVKWYENPDYAVGLKNDTTVPGGKTSPWFLNATAGWTKKQISQELLTSFLESGDTFIDAETIIYYQELANKVEPLAKIGPENGLWIYENPVPGHQYIFATDSASGTAEDFSTLIILDTKEMSVSAVFKGKLPPDVFAEWIIEEVAPNWNTPLIIPENNNIGMVTAFTMRNTGYRNLAFIDDKSGKLIDKWTAEVKGINPGFSTGIKNRPVILQQLESALRNKELKITCKRFVNELLSFVWKNGKPQAKKDCNDDIIMALAIALWARESFFFFNSDATQEALSMYGAVSLSTKKNDMMTPGGAYERERIKKHLKDQSTIKVGNQLIRMDWINKL